VATKSNKAQVKDRKARVEEMRRQQKAQERRKNILFIGIASVVALIIVAAAATPAILGWLNDPAREEASSFGASAAAASCDAVISEEASGVGTHVGPGTDSPDTTRVEYATVPPTFGQHYAIPAPFSRKFYTADDRPPMEQLVHNLEHGYTVVWYDDTIGGDQLDALRDLSDNISSQEGSEKFIVSAWDASYGDFPEGKHVALSHWGAEQGHRQLCGQVSGEVIEDFVQTYPSTDSPEPNGA
jgi:Protein of unknown function (DUF3105)